MNVVVHQFNKENWQGPARKYPRGTRRKASYARKDMVQIEQPDSSFHGLLGYFKGTYRGVATIEIPVAQDRIVTLLLFEKQYRRV